MLGDTVGEVGAGGLDQFKAVFKGILKEDRAAHSSGRRREGGREERWEGRS